MLGLVAAWRQQVDNDQSTPYPLLSGVYAQAGTFNNAPPTAANDLAAALFILLLFWWWNCARYSAILTSFCAIRAKTNAPRNFAQARRKPLPYQAFQPFPGLSHIIPGLCQINISPTMGG